MIYRFLRYIEFLWYAKLRKENEILMKMSEIKTRLDALVTTSARILEKLNNQPAPADGDVPAEVEASVVALEASSAALAEKVKLDAPVV